MTRLLSLIALVGTLVAARAQQVHLEFVCLPRSAESVDLKLSVGDGKLVDVSFSSNEVSQPIAVPSLPVYKFGIVEKNAAGEPVFKTLARAKPLPAAKQLFVFIRKGKSNDDGFHVVRFSSDPSGFRARRFLVMNLTAGNIAGDIGGDRFKLTPGKAQILAPKENKGKNLCYADLRYFRDDKWRAFFTSNWPIADKRRGLIFIYQKPGSSRPRLHTIVDVVQ